MKCRTAKVSTVVLLLILPALFGCRGDQVNRPELPELPLRITQRNSRVPDGQKVAVFTNTSSSTLSVVITFENEAFQQRKVYNAVFAPGETREFGWLEGWTVLPGETARATCPGYKERRVTFME